MSRVPLSWVLFPTWPVCRKHTPRKNLLLWAASPRRRISRLSGSHSSCCLGALARKERAAAMLLGTVSRPEKHGPWALAAQQVAWGAPLPALSGLFRAKPLFWDPPLSSPAFL